MKAHWVWMTEVLFLSSAALLAAPPSGDHNVAAPTPTAAPGLHPVVKKEVQPICGENPKDYICGGAEERPERIQQDLLVDDFKNWIKDDAQEEVLRNSRRGPHRLKSRAEIFENIFMHEPAMPGNPGGNGPSETPDDGQDVRGRHRAMTGPEHAMRPGGPGERMLQLAPPFREYLLGVYGRIFSKLDLEEEDFKSIQIGMLDRLRKTDAIKDREGHPDVTAIANMVGKVAKTQIVIDLDGLLEAMKTPGAFVDEFLSTCGEKGMVFNAFYFEPSNSVIPCPGLLASAVDPKMVHDLIKKEPPRSDDRGPRSGPPPLPKKSPVNMALVRMIIGHELGHAVDSATEHENFEPNYRPFVRCLYQHYKKLPNGTTIGNIDIVKNFSSEAIADNYGAYALAELLNDAEFVRQSGMSKYELARMALKNFCDDPEQPRSGGHPVPEYRLKFIVMKNPSLRAALQPMCPAEPSCTFGGYQVPTAAKH